MKTSNQPKILKRLIQQLVAQNHTVAEARLIAIAALKRSGNLDSNGKVTKQGEERGNMTAGERAIDRQSKYSGKPKSEFKYNKRTNRATLKD
jgi:hypothetical protein